MNNANNNNYTFKKEDLPELWFSFMHGLVGSLQKCFRLRRDEEGLTQKELARRLEWDEGYLSRCLSGQQNMTVRKVHDLSRGMGYRLEIKFVPLETLRPSNRSTGIRSELVGKSTSASETKFLLIPSKPLAHAA